MRRTTTMVLLLSAAGLHSQVAVPATTWFQNARMCYDQARQRLMFAVGRDIWEWDGGRWGKVSVRLPVDVDRLVYDATRRRVLVLGGGRLLDYDGHAFVDHGSAPAITCLAVDENRGRVVGLQAGPQHPWITYEWDGTQWQQVATMPARLVVEDAAYDVARHVIVAQLLNQSGLLFETWEWNGTSWVLAYADTVYRGPFAYDSVRQQVFAVGNGSWTWNGTAWQRLVSYAPIAIATLASDPAHGRVWLFDAVLNLQRVWDWDGATWTLRLEVPHPPAAAQDGFTFDSVRHRAVLIGGRDATGLCYHHEWDGRDWHRLQPLTVPTTRAQHVQVFDAVRGETVLFGGQTGPNLISGETWLWNGINWRFSAVSGPAPRYEAAAAFDSVRGRVVVVGGTGAAGLLADHWEWDGIAWTLVSATTPMGTVRSVMGFDPARNRLVLVDDSSITWEWNGSWTQVTTTGPRSAGARSLVWDPVRQRLQGNLMDASFNAQRYEWDGVQWTPRFVVAGGRYLAMDDRLGAMLQDVQDQLTVETNLPAGTAEFGSPCGGSGTVTSLTAFRPPRPGDADFHLDVRAQAALRPVLIGFGLARGNLPLGNGCTLLVQQPIATLGSANDVAGCLHLALGLPANLVLRGTSFVAQAAVLDPASPGGIALSQGLVLTLGD